MGADAVVPVGPSEEGERFKWSLPLNGGRSVVMQIRCDGKAARITKSADLTPEEMDGLSKWLKKLARDLTKIRDEGWPNKCA